MQTEPTRAGGAIPRPLFYLAAATLAAAMAAPARADFVGPMPQASVGTASWYGHEFSNRPTASGERFDPHGLTGAHRTLPIGTKVRVTNLRNGRSVLVRITDRGPFKRRRVIDVSLGAARALGMVERGVERVLIEPLS